MSQIRLFVDCTEYQARSLSPLVETAFEEEGYPVASFETDAAAGSWSVSIYVPAEQVDEVEKRLGQLLSGAAFEGEIGRQELDNTDWVSQTLADLKPVRAGRFIVHGSHDRDTLQVHEIAIEIDAGIAFGTGHHGTTAGCLDMLDHCLKARRYRNALDLGTGSGVLAIAIAKSLPIHVLASDIDADSVATARDNCRLNGVSNRVEVIRADGFNHRSFFDNCPFDLVVANILAGPLQKMAHDLARHVARRGTVILSGLLPHQKPRIVASYRQQGLRLERAHLRDGWLTLVLSRP
ncbi:MAG: 50S ribosomal protein L11 methyltransferase [Salaquimonas sp.]|nr:50S ribosomal protein L11 methyltransferase [Salaquimonas sp.]